MSTDNILFRLRAEPFQIAVENARAQPGEVRNQIMNLKASYQQAQAEIYSGASRSSVLTEKSLTAG
ncbi:hypothetical protein BK648_24685 [Pseudomonas poae]|uniref:Uncharacterized protein n=1 Tax=Pseudomonas poae TaxID=200451 RepID=A0A423ERK4_9PSED|nr:hypothetical protein [Pseudomonas poae]ROM33959.1 hypothetical protein BK648_24685 [Pseudomonas poae]